jgi:hypothetical protein
MSAQPLRQERERKSMCRKTVAKSVGLFKLQSKTVVQIAIKNQIKESSRGGSNHNTAARERRKVKRPKPVRKNTFLRTDFKTSHRRHADTEKEIENKKERCVEESYQLLLYLLFVPPCLCGSSPCFEIFSKSGCAHFWLLLFYF